MREFHFVSRRAVVVALMAGVTSAALPGSATAAIPAALAGNPLLETWNTPDGVPPYDRIETQHYLPAIEEGMRQARAELDAIANASEAPSFANTIEAMERSSQLLNRTLMLFFTISPSDGTPEIQEVEEDISPKLARFTSETHLNPRLFARVDRLYRDRQQLGLTPEQARLLEITHRDFLRDGAGLDAAGKQRLAAIDERLAAISVEFGKRILADQKAGDTWFTEAEMAGMPEDFRSSAAARAAAAGRPGAYLVTATRSDFESFLTLATNRAAREKLFRAFDDRGDRGDGNDTNDLITETVRLRLERAKLLGYRTHAEYALETSMAKTPAAAMELLEQVYAAGLRKARTEEAELQALATADGIDALAPWDWRYYAEKVRSQRYAFDENRLKPYLPLKGMLDGLKDTTERLFGLKMVERTDIPVWKPDVRTFDVFEADGRRVGLFYADWFTRDTKSPGAWMNEIRMQNGLTGETPQVVNNANFIAPAEGQRALLSFDDAETMFHEFGHALHGLLSATRYPTLSGTNVYRDFVEFPSQLYEHWVSDRAILAAHARNSADEPMPAELLDALMRARNFNQGYQTVQQLASALVDMELHQLEAIPADFDPRRFERETLAKYAVPTAVGMRHRLPHFAHIFNGGYSAGYYAYTWSEVLEADAFSKWEESGNVWDRGVADSYRREILMVGNSRPPEESYLAFRGRMPNADALLRYRGLDQD